ncbi:MAG: class I adenylate-forming enzyme family protein [Pseudomonadota bacterium]
MTNSTDPSIYSHFHEGWEALTGAGGDFAVTTTVVRGVPIRTYAAAPPSLREVWLSTLQFPERDYLVYESERWTYAQAHQEVAALAGWLTEQGIGPGDRVALAMRNYPEWLLAYWATLCVGAAAVGMNAWWVGPELVYGLNDAKPKALFADKERLERLAAHRGEFDPMPVVAVRCDTEVFPDAIAYDSLKAQPGTLPDLQIDPDSDACIFYTSGTTGRPKGAQLTHRGCVANLMNMGFNAALNTFVAQRAGETIPDPESLPQPAALVTTPLFHVTANNCVAHPITANGGKLICTYRWDAGEALKIIEREKITAMTGVPVMARELLAHPDFPSTDTSTLQTLGGGGAQLQPDLVAKIDESVAARPNTGYGMTETCGIITAISGDFFVDRPESAGPAMPVFEAITVNADGEALPTGELGELWVRGAPVIKGYLNREDATAESITDGWLHTGDIGRIDEQGFIYIVDRLKDMVLRGGENVYCAEVESTIFEHESVAECTVFGVPDDRLGEEVGAAVVVKPGASITADALRAHCAEHIAKHKIPRYIWLRDEALPRNASGKFLKRELRESLQPGDAA